MSQRERPILFSAPLVRAILAGTKTVTRRPVKSPHIADLDTFAFDSERGEWEGGVYGDHGAVAHGEWVRCPYGQTGDRLWVRETLRRADSGKRGERWVYGADDATVTLPREDPRVPAMIGWAHHKEGDVCTSIHMPRWASRILLEVTDVRVERLQEITEEDARAEGVTVEPCACCLETSGRGCTEGPSGGCCPCCLDTREGSYREAFAHKWDEIYGDGSWNASPWVWRIAFKRVEVPGG